MKNVEKLIELKLNVNAPIETIREILNELLKVSKRKEVSDLSYRNLDYYNGHWTEDTIVKAANKIIRLPSKRLFRKSDKQREK